MSLYSDRLSAIRFYLDMAYRNKNQRLIDIYSEYLKKTKSDHQKWLLAISRIGMQK